MSLGIANFEPIHYALVFMTTAVITAIIVFIIQRDVIHNVRTENEGLRHRVNTITHELYVLKQRSGWSNGDSQLPRNIHNKNTLELKSLNPVKLGK